MGTMNRRFIFFVVSGLISAFSFVGCKSLESAVEQANLAASRAIQENPSTPPTSAPPAENNSSFCPAYVDSLYRARARQIVVGPNDAWMDMIQNAASDTEVLLRDGTYQHNRYSVNVPANITIRGLSGNRDAVIIRGQGYGPDSEAFFTKGSNITIADLTMHSIRNHAISVKGEFGSHNIQIYNVHLYDIGTDHIKVTPGFLRKWPRRLLVHWLHNSRRRRLYRWH